MRPSISNFAGYKLSFHILLVVYLLTIIAFTVVWFGRNSSTPSVRADYKTDSIKMRGEYNDLVGGYNLLLTKAKEKDEKFISTLHFLQSIPCDAGKEAVQTDSYPIASLDAHLSCK